MATVTPDPTSQGSTESDFYLFEVLLQAWRRRWLVVFVTLLSTAIAVVVALLLPSWYRAEVLLVSANEGTALGLGGEFGGLASLAGIDIGQRDNPEAVAVLRSRDLARRFIEDNDLVREFFADKWDPVARAWRSSRLEDQPDIRDAIRFFDRSIRSVSEDRRTQLVTLTIEWKDPQKAAAWANSLVDLLNDDMRTRSLTEAGENIDYLQKELSATTTVALQQSISRLLENELQKVMLARGNKDYAFRVVDRADVPKRKSKPQRTFIALVGTLLGGVLGVLSAVILSTFEDRREVKLREKLPAHSS